MDSSLDVLLKIADAIDDDTKEKYSEIKILIEEDTVSVSGKQRPQFDRVRVTNLPKGPPSANF